MNVKTTILINEATWEEFKKFVSSRYGSLRMTSLAVEEAIKCFNAVGLLRSFSKAIGLETDVYPSIREVQERRPRLGTLAGEEVRGMRDERQTRLSRHKQHREEVY
ncbi:hypothetical protein KEJ26_05035 [Candidatus Bathyarchaeota archaeon]|nr:hypothetical protein [Candidatus Bathyarchaeota archaeon]